MKKEDIVFDIPETYKSVRRWKLVALKENLSWVFERFFDAYTYAPELVKYILDNPFAWEFYSDSLPELLDNELIRFEGKSKFLPFTGFRGKNKPMYFDERFAEIMVLICYDLLDDGIMNVVFYDIHDNGVLVENEEPIAFIKEMVSKFEETSADQLIKEIIVRFPKTIPIFHQKERERGDVHLFLSSPNHFLLAFALTKNIPEAWHTVRPEEYDCTGPLYFATYAKKLLQDNKKLLEENEEELRERRALQKRKGK